MFGWLFCFPAPGAKSKKEATPVSQHFKGYEECIRAIESGGFVAHLAKVFDASWGAEYAALAGFPVSVIYTGVRDGVLARSCYIAFPSTFSEDAECRELIYAPRQPALYSIHILHKKGAEQWEIFKIHGERVICESGGKTIKQAMLHATMMPLESDEPALPAGNEIGVAGLYIWTPVAEETVESQLGVGEGGAEVSERDRLDVTERTDSLEVNSGENRLRKFGQRIWQDSYRRDISRWIGEAASSDDPEAALGALIRDFATAQEFAGEMFARLTIPAEGVDSLQKGGNA
jgi:hypothetical protein